MPVRLDRPGPEPKRITPAERPSKEPPRFLNTNKCLKNGRGSKIRTCDPLVPNQMRYQAALYPDPLIFAGVSGLPRIVKGEECRCSSHPQWKPADRHSHSPARHRCTRHAVAGLDAEFFRQAGIQFQNEFRRAVGGNVFFGERSRVLGDADDGSAAGNEKDIKR